MTELPILDQLRKMELTPYGESVRLSNELRAKPPTSFIDSDGNTINKPAMWGFDCETALYSDFTTWLNDVTIKKSPSLFWFVIRIMVWRFENKHSEIRNNLNLKHRDEFDLIISKIQKNFDWVGKVGYQNMVRLDGSLTNKNVRVITSKNKSIKIKRI